MGLTGWVVGGVYVAAGLLFVVFGGTGGRLETGSLAVFGWIGGKLEVGFEVIGVDAGCGAVSTGARDGAGAGAWA